MKRAFASAKIPAVLEPIGLSRSDGKRPDGVTLHPWARGKALVWDFTCPDTLANSHLGKSVSGASETANEAELKKSRKYANLPQSYMFVPIAIETLGAWGSSAKKLISDLGNKIQKETGDPRSTSFLRQRISVGIQRGNAASVLGSSLLGENLVTDE